MTKNTAITTVNKLNQKKYHKPNNSYKVTSEFILYKIADAGLLFTYLHGVNKDKDGNKVFHFDRHDDIKEIIDRFEESEVIASYE